jgi:competence protein ComEA
MRRVEVLRLPQSAATNPLRAAEQQQTHSSVLDPVETTIAGQCEPEPGVKKAGAEEDGQAAVAAAVVSAQALTEAPPANVGRHRRVDQVGSAQPRTVVGGWVPDRRISEPALVAEPIDGPDAENESAAWDHSDEFANNDDDDDPDDHDQENPVIRPRRVGRTWGRFAELWIPENMRDARLDPGRRGALILLLVAALAAVATAVGVWRDRPEPRPVETTALAQVGVSPIDVSSGAETTDSTAPAFPPGAGAQTSAAPAEPAEIIVSVTGLVANPGVVKLPPGSRVADAIAAAGGVTVGADLTGLNLAAKLSDGESVVVGDAAAAHPAAASGVSGASGAAGGSGDATGGSLINLNTADEAALDTLPGVGPVMAQNILAWREANGKFSSIEQLQEISGIGPSRYAQISQLVTVS